MVLSRSRKSAFFIPTKLAIGPGFLQSSKNLQSSRSLITFHFKVLFKYATMTPVRYYKRAVLIPSAIIILGYILYTIYDLTIGPGKDYKSEWFTAGSIDEYMIGMIILHCIIVALLCCPIFLTHYPKIQRSPVLSFLSWFLLPGIYLGNLLFQVFIAVYSQIDVPGTCLFILPPTLPFIFSLIVTFIKFRRHRYIYA